MAKDLKRNWIFWYITIVVLAIFVRLIPALTNIVWGGDFGIYYGLTKTFVESGQFFNPYYGFGTTYHQFPVLYVVSGGLHILTGLPIVDVMMKAIPIFGGLSVAVFFFVAKEVLGDVKKSLLAMSLLSVMPNHVFPTAHAAPLTLGHFFMIFSMYFFIKSRKDRRYIYPLAITSLLLAMTHHLTTYMYIIVIMFVIFYDNWSFKHWKPHFKQELLFLLSFSSFVFLYWKFIATDVYISTLNDLVFGMDISQILVILSFYFSILFGIGIILLRRRFNSYKKHKKLPHPTLAKILFLFIIMLSVSVMLLFTTRSVPWLELKLEVVLIPLLFPTVLILGFGAVGFCTHRNIPNGDIIRGWFLAILFSFLISLIFGSAMKYDRHLEYLMIPISLVAVFGVIYFTKEKFFKREFIYILVIFALVLSNVTAMVPIYRTINITTIPETVSESDLKVIYWVNENISKNGTVICSDHRIERFFEAFNYTTTRDSTYSLWNSTEIEDIYDYSITHIFIDNYMLESGVLLTVGKGLVQMTNESYRKFKEPPFYLLYSNVSDDTWAEFYKVER